MILTFFTKEYKLGSGELLRNLLGRVGKGSRIDLD